jgi:purine-binding chemotaxis protein CheW
MNEVDEKTQKQLCTFTVGNLLFGVDVSEVQEVIRHQEMTPVPLAPALVRGLINLRGQIVTAIDLRCRLNLPQTREATNVIVRHGNGVVSLLVDEIGDVVEVDRALFEPSPQTLQPRTKELTTGVYKLTPHLLLLLDTERAVQTGTPAMDRDKS